MSQNYGIVMQKPGEAAISEIPMPKRMNLNIRPYLCKIRFWCPSVPRK